MNQGLMTKLSKTGGLLLAPTILFILVPHQLIKNNILEFSYPVTGVYIFLGLFALWYLVTASAMLFWPKKERGIMLASVAIGINVFFWNAGGLTLEKLPIAAVLAIELAVFGVVLLILRKLSLKTMSSVFLTIALVEILWVGIDHYQTWKHWKEIAQVGKMESKAAVRSASQRGNVYHIILDTFQGEAYDYFRDNRPEILNKDLIYYPNFVTNEGRTAFSNAMLVLSRLYEPEISPSEWQKTAFQRGFFNNLAESQIPLFEYPYHPYYCHKKAQYCKHTSKFIQRTDNVLGGPTRIFLDLTFLNVIPKSLKKHLNGAKTSAKVGGDSFNWGYGFSITVALAPLYVSEVNSTHLPQFSKLVFEQLIEDEASRPANGSYIFAHLILPHAPYVLNENCDYSPPEQELDSMDLQGFFPQAICSLKLIDKLIAKLKDLGRYDDAMIIVHGDHGLTFHPKYLGEMNQYLGNLDANFPDVDLNKGDSAKFRPEVLATRTSGLLLVKFPKAVDPTPTDVVPQTIDLGPTILRHFDIALPEEFHGTPLQDLKANDLRKIFSMMTTSIPDIENPNKFSKYIRNPDGKWTFFEDIFTTK